MIRQALRKVFSSIYKIILFFSFILLSCKPSSSPSSIERDETIRVIVNLSKVLSRSCYPSVNIEDFKEFTLEAYCKDVRTNDYCFNDVSYEVLTNKEGVILKQEGNYVFTLEAKINEMLYKSQVEAYLSQGTYNINFTLSYDSEEDDYETTEYGSCEYSLLLVDTGNVDKVEVSYVCHDTYEVGSFGSKSQGIYPVSFDAPCGEGVIIYDFYGEGILLGTYKDKVKVSKGLTSKGYGELNSVNDIHSITYETNGGNIVDNYVISFSAMSEEITLPANVHKEGYVFAGWYTSSLFTGEAITVLHCGNKDVVLYAKWKEGTDTRYKVIHHFKDGSVETVLEGTTNSYTEAEPLNRYGYHLQEAIQQALIEASGSTIVDVYYEPNLYTLTFFTGSENLKYEGYYGTSLEEVKEPARDGYIFQGWEDSLGNEISFPYAFNKDETLYAKWLSITSLIDVSIVEDDFYIKCRKNGAYYILQATEGYGPYKWFVDGKVSEVIVNEIVINEESKVFVFGQKGGRKYCANIFL